MALVVPMLFTLLAARPALAAHETIIIDGDLTDLIQAVNDNLGAGTGGFMANDPAGDIYTGTCAYVNGYDIRQIFTFIDFTDGMGNPTPNDVTLYAGWIVEGIIGDVDGDGDPDTFNPASPGGSSKCALSDEPGIGPNESYNLLLDLDCIGALDDIRIAVKNNVVGVVQGANIIPLPGAEFAFSGSMLEVMIPNYQDILPNLGVEGDLCNARIRQTANAEFDGPGEDFVIPPFQLQVSPSIDIRKTPPVQEVCAGQDPSWTITVINDGLCMIDDLIITDTLQVGMTFVSSDSASTGDDQVRVWQFMGINLAPLDSVVINLVARLDTPCPGDTLWNRVTVEAVHTSTCRDTPEGAIASSSAQVLCVEPCGDLVTADDPLAACPGETVLVPFTFTSCSDRPQSVTWFAVCGEDTVQGTTLGVPANGQVGIEVPCILPLECVGSIELTVYAELSVDNFDGCSIPLEASRTIRCYDPCLTIIPVDEKVRACAGADVSAGFWVYNCTSLDTLDLDLTAIAGDLTGVSSSTIPAFLAPGDSVLITVTAQMPAECFAGDFDLGLVGTGTIRGADCFARANATTGVNCVEACLTVEFNRGPFSACAGDTFDVVFDVTNCSTTDSADVDLTGFCDAMGAISVSPETVRLGPGEQIEVTVTCAMPAECTGPVVAKLSAEASVVGLEGPGCVVVREQTHTVNCVDVCLAVIAPPDTAVCAGDTVTVSFDVTNCNEPVMRGGDVINGDVEGQIYVITATCNGVPVEAFPSEFSLGPGGTQKVDVRCVLPDACEGDIVVDFKAVAQFVSGPACADSATAQATVRCVEACAELYCPVGTDPKACVGDTLSVPFRAKNCNTSGLAEIFLVDPTVVGGTFLDLTPAVPQVVAAGDSVDYIVRIIMPAECADNISVQLDLSAALEDDRLCATTTSLTKFVDCVDPCITVQALEEPLVVCAPDTARAGFNIANCSNETMVIDLTGYCDDMLVAVDPAQLVLAPGANSVVYVVCYVDSCTAAAPRMARLDAVGYVQGSKTCTAEASDTKVIDCTTACLVASVLDAPQTICAGDTAYVTFTLENCNPTYSETVDYTADCDGAEILSSSAVIGPNGTLQVQVACFVPDTCSTAITVRLIGTAQVDGFGELCAVSDTAFATIDCLMPCIELTPPDPVVACAGTDRVPVPFVLENCGNVAVRYTCLVFCNEVPQGLDAGLDIMLEPGEKDTLIAYCNLPGECAGDHDVRMEVVAVAVDPLTGEILRACNVEATASAIIECVEACVTAELTPGYGPYSGCAGDVVPVYFTIKNCGADAESLQYVATCNGMPVDVTDAVYYLEPGDSAVVVVACTLPEVCEGPLNVSLTVSASIPGLEGEGCQDTATITENITCVEPCLLVAAPSDSLFGCAGDTIDVVFKVTNCNPAQLNEEFELTATCNGMPIVLPVSGGVFAPGDHYFTVPCVLPVDCSGDIEVVLEVTATVEGFKGCSVTTSATKLIGCAEGCVLVEACQERITACADSDVLVPFVVKNCTENTEELVTVSAWCDDEPVLLAQTEYVLAPGDSVIIEVPCTMPDWCMGVVNVRLVAEARKNGDVEGACPARSEATCPVYCVEACVSACARFEGPVCPGDSLCVPFEVMNCNEFETEVFMFKYKIGTGPIQTLDLVLELGPGEIDTICVPVKMPMDCPAEGVKVILEPIVHIKGLPDCKTKGYAEIILECAEACLTVEGPEGPLRGCPGDTLEVPFTVTNCSAVPLAVNMNAACDGELIDTVYPWEFYLQPGESIVSTVTCVVPESCPERGYFSIVNSAWAMSANGMGCMIDVADDVRVNCNDCETGGDCGPLAITAPPGVTGCPGDPISFQFSVENQGEAPVDIYVSSTTPGWTFDGSTFLNVASGDPVNIEASGTAPEDFNQAKQVELCAVSYPAGSNPQETAPCDTAKVLVNVTSQKMLIGVYKTASPDTVTALNSTSRITIVVSNYGESGPLDPVTLTDYMPGSIVYAGNLTSNCGVTTTAVPGDTCVMFSPFSLKPGQSCTISFDVTCLADGAWVDTAVVVAYCEGSQTSFREVRDTALIVCKEARTACPRTIGFWRQQAEQRNNGSRKICEEDAADAMDMHRLWRQVIDMTDVIAFKANSDSDDESMITTTSLRNLSDDELFDALGCQLRGPTPMTKRDMAELQYLALMLNVKAGVLPLDLVVDNDSFEGTIQEAIDAVEAILNNPAATTGQLTSAIDISDKINNRLGLMAQTCVGGENAPFNGFASSCPDDNAGYVCPGDEDSAPDHVGGTGAPVAGKPSIVAYPNPFNPTAVLRFTIPQSSFGQTAVVEVYDATGRSVERLFEGVVTSEVHEILLSPDNWASGLYIARLTVGTESVVYRMMLVK